MSTSSRDSIWSSLDGVANPFADWVKAQLGLGILGIERIRGGNSNLTYLVETTDGSRLVLRRPPAQLRVSAYAHDMAREVRVMQALKETAVPVPVVVGYHEGGQLGTFYVMTYVEGRALRVDSDVEQMSAAARERGAHAMVDAMAQLHSCNVVDLGLADLGPGSSYVQRQVDRWSAQFAQTAGARSSGTVSSLVREIAMELRLRIAKSAAVVLIHGDYGPHNCLISNEGILNAIVDWELCTLGDPLADLGLFLAYWTDPEDVSPALRRSPTRLDGFPRRADLLQRYAEQSGVEVKAIDDYLAFAHWKLACVFAGVADRHRRSETALDQANARRFEANVLRLAQRASQLLNGSAHGD